MSSQVPSSEQDNVSSAVLPPKKWKPSYCAWIATGFSTGLAPFMPGTFGTFFALTLAVFLQLIIPGFWGSHWALGLTAATFVLGVFTINMASKAGDFGPEAKDPQQVVIDEFCGLFLTLLYTVGTMKEFLFAFVLFRLFDITKIYPIKKLEKLPDGLGVMIDDVMAGVYARILLALVLWLS